MFQRILVANRGESRCGSSATARRWTSRSSPSTRRPIAPRLPGPGRPRHLHWQGSQHRQLSQPSPDHRRRGGRRRPGDPSGLRVSQREPRLRRFVPDERIRIHRPAPRRHPQDGPEDRGQTDRRRGAGGLRAGLRRRRLQRCPGDAPRPGDRLPDPHQGGRRRRRQGHADLPGRGHLDVALQTARNEAEAAFKNSSVYIEKFIDRPATSRSRSSPTSTAMSSIAGTAIARSSAAIRSSSRNRPRRPCPWRFARARAMRPCGWPREAGYVNAGTCEFLVDADNNFYFIEVNARIQIEHPVTEMVTGIDLVKQQIRIAAGEPLPFSPGRYRRGHSMQCRINSRTPTTNSALSGPDHRFASPRRAGRPLGLAHPGRLFRPALLRLSARQVDRAAPTRDGRSPRCSARSTSWSSRGSRRRSRSTSGFSGIRTLSRAGSTRHE